MLKFPFQIVLGSQSPRRKELLSLMNIDFRVEVQEVEESYPENLTPVEIATHIASKKAKAFKGLSANELLITADTIVWFNNKALNKPKDFQEACSMLTELSGNKHEVYTGVSITSHKKQVSFFVKTVVYFKTLTQEEIEYYVTNYKPYDKAGAYGAQDWIGLIAVERFEGSYFNVMGLPVKELYEHLKDF